RKPNGESPDGQLRELYPISTRTYSTGNDTIPRFRALYTVNLEQWVPSPWTKNENLRDSITSVPPIVRRLNEALKSQDFRPLVIDERGRVVYRVVKFGPNWLSTGTNACACGDPGGNPVNPTDDEDVGSRRFQDGAVTAEVDRALGNLMQMLPKSPYINPKN